MENKILIKNGFNDHHSIENVLLACEIVSGQIQIDDTLIFEESDVGVIVAIENPIDQSYIITVKLNKDSDAHIYPMYNETVELRRKES